MSDWPETIRIARVDFGARGTLAHISSDPPGEFEEEETYVSLSKVRGLLEEAWFDGFVNSGEGFNGEYPFDGDVDAARVDSANVDGAHRFIRAVLDAVGVIGFENVQDGEPIPELDQCICPYPDDLERVRADCPIHDPSGTFHSRRIREGARRFEARHPEAVAKLEQAEKSKKAED